MFDIIPWKRNKKNHSKQIARNISTMYDRFFEPDFLPSSSLFRKGMGGPKLDIAEGRKDITIKAEIPGIEAKDLDISMVKEVF